jgi:kumamolisin
MTIIPGVHPYAVRHHPASPAPTSWTIPDLCAAYDWPSGLAGGGIIGIVELGGGYLASDITAAFTAMQLPAPAISNISVDGVTNNDPSDGNPANGEVTLDIQIAAASYAMATNEAAQVLIFWGQDIAACVTAAANYGCAVCSISWGADEALWGQAAGDAMEDAAHDATASGMIIFAAAGDNDSSDGGPTAANVDLPGSAPHVISCGGTSKPADGAEVVWNNEPGHSNGTGTGGGFSTLFGAQAWQLGVPAAPHGQAPPQLGHPQPGRPRLGRMVPDVSANADPQTGYVIVLDGQPQVFGGTSCVAPLYAGLFAAINPGVGFVTPALYLDQTGFADITVGDNGAYQARRGPDPCSGIGVPVGAVLEALFSYAAC